MFVNNPGLFPSYPLPTADQNAVAVRNAWNLYLRVRNNGWLSRIKALVTEHKKQLLDLETTEKQAHVSNRHYVGIRPVPIRQIHGSESRAGDFDWYFKPLQTHTKGRWLSVATARLKGITLPPVTLIQIGEDYFVRDGHHRVSVANALGEDYIDAEVTRASSGA